TSRLLLLALGLISALPTFAQSLNCTLRDNLDYSEELSDIWGYTAPDGTEYALVGLFNGFSIVSLADPDNIQEVHFISGDNSIWRDIKTYGDYAYVVADQGNDGLLIVDLTGLPNNVTHQYVNLDPPGNGVLQRAHNIYIDETLGYAFIAGANVNSGGMLIYDVATNPGTANFVALGPSVYAHDVYVDDNLMYASEINIGELSIYDISDPSNITLEGDVTTPFAFTHNAWTTSDNLTVFTTDERGNAPVASYDISDRSNPILLDEFRPQRSLGGGAIPHNVHVLGDYLIISSYTDGVEIVDASVPDQMVEVGYYDTWQGGDGGFNGIWGAYPFLPSGLVLGTDIGTGLYVIEVDYVLAGRINGLVTDATNGNPIIGASVQLATTTGESDVSQADGSYALGSPEAGTFVLSCTAAGYEDFSLSLSLSAGDQLDQPIMMQPLSSFAISGQVKETGTGDPIEGAEVRIEGENGQFVSISNAGGAISFPGVFAGDYELVTSKWGFENEGETINISQGSSLNRTMSKGILDGFGGDQGWTTTSTATTGGWERAIPVETSSGGTIANPGEDAGGNRDIGRYAYVTGNGGGGVGTDDIDGGTVTLTSPIIDLDLFSDNNLVVSYQYWFFNGFGSGTPDDQMTIAVDNGSQQQIMKTYTTNDNTTQWTADSFLFADLTISITNSMRIVVTSQDLGGGHVVEAGFDDFRVTQNAALPVEWARFELTPNTSGIWLDWQTARELNNDYFVVERAGENAQFESIGRVEGAQTTIAAQDYRFFDESPLDGLNVYRIRQVDLDGSFDFSELRQYYWLKMDAEHTLFPNPASDWVNTQASDQSPVEITDLSGRMVRQTAVSSGRIDVHGLPTGIYVVRIDGTSLRLVKE
ncbi:MAG: choice-of-anchor B family protein, partial [Bacteroidota bacterium]